VLPWNLRQLISYFFTLIIYSINLLKTVRKTGFTWHCTIHWFHVFLLKPVLIFVFHCFLFHWVIKWNQRFHPMFADCKCLTIALYIDMLILLWNCCFILRVLNYHILLFVWLCKKIHPMMVFLITIAKNSAYT
jgi:hypothetical protein